MNKPTKQRNLSSAKSCMSLLFSWKNPNFYEHYFATIIFTLFLTMLTRRWTLLIRDLCIHHFRLIFNHKIVKYLYVWFEILWPTKTTMYTFGGPIIFRWVITSKSIRFPLEYSDVFSYNISNRLISFLYICKYFENLILIFVYKLF